MLFDSGALSRFGSPGLTVSHSHAGFVTGSSWELWRGPQAGVRPVLDGFYWVGESWGHGDERQSGSNLVVGA